MAKFRSKLPPSLSKNAAHAKELEFMKENGIRQAGPPRIREFADKQRPEPMHNEINAWQHLLNLTYQEAVMRGVVSEFLHILSSPITHAMHTVQPLQSPMTCYSNAGNTSGVGSRVRECELASKAATELHTNLNAMASAPSSRSNSLGCGLPFVSGKIKEHFEVKEKRQNQLSVRLIGAQAIGLARYCFRLIDTLETEDESPSQRIKRLALGKVAQYLRDACCILTPYI